MSNDVLKGQERIRLLQQVLEHHQSLTPSAYEQILDALNSQKESFGYSSKGKLKVAFYDIHSYDKNAFEALGDIPIEPVFLTNSLNALSAIQAKGCLAVCVFVNDDCSAPVIERLAMLGVKLIALRCSGYNNVDLDACAAKGIDVVRVPEYSPYAVAEHTVALMLMLNRKLHQAYMRNKNGQYVLDGLVGFDMRGKQVGIIGLGKIGKVLVDILSGFGCEILAYDVKPDPALEGRDNLRYVSLNELAKNADIISLHAPLCDETYHLVDAALIEQMKAGVMLINTGRGALIDTKALIQGLKSQKIGAAGIDVYEEEADIFFKDKSGEVLTDDVFARLTTFNNVVITSHQGFLTHEALRNIAQTTLQSLTEFKDGQRGLGLSYSVLGNP
ncbi:2-hydroxyacid dehydrogenase [Glaciecola sp. MH2013]|uniref:2-hydroxyacid dehydrogenase n=1 Tax=Glaciecola sp. MH2013 TaxID=2785524 RepID=UPI00189FDF53|nr:2-hydroxyacid dehydrogenase [Glaciecola sp. MH2013]MBF7071951.1 2-hydroxyacid dehydrogenase [Glaciecola sp. MH2013]